MRTVRCSGHLSCHTWPLPCIPPCHTSPLPCMLPLSCMPPAMHASHHAFPPPSMAPCHAHPLSPCMPPTTHAHLWTEFLTHACEAMWSYAPWYWHLVVITGDLFRLIHLKTYPLPPPSLISSGGHRNMYSWQADGTHITGMMSCFHKCTKPFLSVLFIWLFCLEGEKDSRQKVVKTLL